MTEKIVLSVSLFLAGVVFGLVFSSMPENIVHKESVVDQVELQNQREVSKIAIRGLLQCSEITRNYNLTIDEMEAIMESMNQVINKLDKVKIL
jgi:hypothetical protein